MVFARFIFAGAAIWAVSLSVVEARDGRTWSFSGSIAIDLRWFPETPAFPGQLDATEISVAFEPELRWRSASRRHQVAITAFGRYDDPDDERSHVDLREGYYRYIGNRFELLAGVDKVFWGVAESRHLVDVINQTDAVEDIDEEDKLGQPMFQIAWERDWGRLEIISLLGFRERTFPGGGGRLRPLLMVDTDAAGYESGAEEGRIDWAARWTHAFGAWDLGLHVFHGTGREPQLLARTDGGLVPFYRVTSQVGVDVQHTRGAWLWKLEALARQGQGAAFGAAVTGFEHTFYQVGGSAADLGLLVEVLWDGRDSTAPVTIFDEDTFIGTRLALNDVKSTELLTGIVIDHDDGSIVAVLEAARRFGRHFTFELEARLFPATDPAGDLAAVDRDSFVNLRAAWHW